MKNKFILLSLILFCACSKEKYFSGPQSYSDGFENYTSVEELIDGEDQRWSFSQQTFAGNTVQLDSNIVHSGKYSLRCFAMPSTAEGGASKSDIAKQKMAFWENEVVQLEAWFYLAGNNKAQWLFLMDLEEQVEIGAGPGIRIALVEDRLLVEHKYPNPNIEQREDNALLFPRNQWVKVSMETKLSMKKEGYIKVWQDDQLILERQEWKTLPKDILYFQQGTKGMYSSVQFGITANTHDNEVTLYVDDVDIRVLK